jgi:hypothetical protein
MVTSCAKPKTHIARTATYPAARTPGRGTVERRQQKILENSHTAETKHVWEQKFRAMRSYQDLAGLGLLG